MPFADRDCACGISDGVSRSGTAQTTCAYELQRMFVSQHRYLTVIKDQIDFDLMFPDFSPADLIIIISVLFASMRIPPVTPDFSFLQHSRHSCETALPQREKRVQKRSALFLDKPSPSGSAHRDCKELTAFAPFFLVGEALFRSYVDYAEEKKNQE